MKKNAITYFFTLLFGMAYSQPPDGDPNWELVFNDDFNALNTTLWQVANHSDNGVIQANNNKCIYLPDNVITQSGALHIESKPQSYQCPPAFQNTPQNNPNYPGEHYGCNILNYDYSTGAIVSRNFNFHYGYYEARIQMDASAGLWPSFWLWHLPGTGVSEIDIFEMVPNTAGIIYKFGPDYTTSQNLVSAYSPPMDKNYMTTNIHWDLTPNSNSGNTSQEWPHYFKINNYESWHTYGLEWWPDKISWYVDGVLIRSIVPPTTFIHTSPMHVILGSNVSAWGRQGLTTFPSKWMDIDFFRYYKLKANCNSQINTACYNFANHTDEVKLSYDIGLSCYNTVPNDKNYIFKGKNYVSLNKDEFYVPVGSSIFVDSQKYCETTNYNSIPLCWLGFDVNCYNFCCYDNGIKNYIKIYGGSCNNIVLPTENVKLKATEYINIKDNFSVPLGSEIEIKIENCQ